MASSPGVNFDTGTSFLCADVTARQKARQGDVQIFLHLFGAIEISEQWTQVGHPTILHLRRVLQAAFYRKSVPVARAS